MARVLAKAVLAEAKLGPDLVAVNLARAIEACHAGDRGALPKLLARAMQQAERT